MRDWQENFWRYVDHFSRAFAEGDYESARHWFDEALSCVPHSDPNQGTLV